MKWTNWLPSLSLVVFLFFSSSAAWACRCRQQSLEGYYSQAEIVFFAKILAERSESDAAQREVAFQLVGEAFKGDPQKISALRSARSSSQCGLEFEIGSTYLIFTHSLPDTPGIAYVNYCQGSRRFDPDKPSTAADFSDSPAAGVVAQLRVLKLGIQQLPTPSSAP